MNLQNFYDTTQHKRKEFISIQKLAILKAKEDGLEKGLEKGLKEGKKLQKLRE